MLLASQEYSHFRSYAEYKSGENSQRLHNEEAVSRGEQVGWAGGQETGKGGRRWRERVQGLQSLS